MKSEEQMATKTRQRYTDGLHLMLAIRESEPP